MSYYGGGYGGMGGMGGMGGGSSQQMMSLSSSVLLLSVAAAGVWMLTQSGKSSASNQSAQQQYQQQGSQQQQQGSQQQYQQPMQQQQQQSGSAGASAGARGMDGRWNITYGGLTLGVDTKDCTTSNVWFDDITGGNKQQWNFRAVPGREDVYQVHSEERLFDKGCEHAYLTAPTSCTGPATLDKPQFADRQWWQLVPNTAAGGYELRNVACANKRWPSYMISSGSAGGVSNTARLASRAGAPYILRKS